MKRAWSLAAVAALALVLGSTGAKEKDDDKVPPIKDIMKKANAGPKSLLAGIANGLKADDPDWEAVGKNAKEIFGCGQALTKNQPKKGDKESWEKLSGAYCKCTKTLSEAAEKKDKEAASAAVKKIQGMCATCHKAHKPS